MVDNPFYYASTPILDTMTLVIGSVFKGGVLLSGERVGMAKNEKTGKRWKGHLRKTFSLGDLVYGCAGKNVMSPVEFDRKFVGPHVKVTKIPDTPLEGVNVLLKQAKLAMDKKVDVIFIVVGFDYQIRKEEGVYKLDAPLQRVPLVVSGKVQHGVANVNTLLAGNYGSAGQTDVADKIMRREGTSSMRLKDVLELHQRCYEETSKKYPDSVGANADYWKVTENGVEKLDTPK